jgi:hypothetical protein
VVVQRPGELVGEDRLVQPAQALELLVEVEVRSASAGRKQSARIRR